MATITYNPYPEIGTQLTTGLDAIATNLTVLGSASVDELVNEVYSYVQGIYYPSGGGTLPKQTEVEIKSVAYNIVNSYNNKALGNTLTYNAEQTNIINMMVGLNTTNNTPINALDKWILDIEDNISKADMTIDEQTPLLLAIECAKSINTYWETKVTTPGDWATFFDATSMKNYINISLWTEACIEGVLIGANASQKGLIAPTTDIISVNIVSALIGALVIGAGKVIFKWVPRIQPVQLAGGGGKLMLNKETISRLNPDEFDGDAAVQLFKSKLLCGSTGGWLCRCGPSIHRVSCESHKYPCEDY